MKVEPYLFFDGRCDEAIEFYRRTLDAEVLFHMRFSESPDPPPPGMIPPGWENKVMHANLRIGDTDVMASDGRGPGKPSFQAFLCRSRQPMMRKPSAYSPHWPRTDKCRCPSGRRSFPRASAW
jgi:uncharacterized glyoxalase superfamily protein PhnB